MKIPNTIKNTRGALKQFTLGLAVSAAVVLGTGLTANAAISYNFSTGLQGWTQIYPTTGDLWASYPGWWTTPPLSDGHLGAGWEEAETQMGRSPEFKLNGSGDLTFQTHGSKSPLAAVDVTPSTVPEYAIEAGGFCGLALRDVAADTYVLSRGQSVDLYEVFTTLSFTAAELAPFANDGKVYTLDWIDYDKQGGGGWGWLEAVSIPGVSTACDITAFSPGAVIDQGAKTITWYVPFGTTSAQVAALAPTYTLSTGATCNQPNGGVPTPPLSTTGSVTYKVTAEDTVTTKEYTVTVTVLPNETTVIWNVAGNGAWDTSTLNWLGQASGFPMLFSDGLAVIFDKIEGGTITVSPNMAPGSTTVGAASGTYTFSGGAIAGSGTLTKSGDGTLVLSGANKYTGKTIVEAGTLSLGIPLTSAGVAGPLGAPIGANATIDLNTGTTFEVMVPGLANPTSDRAINLAGTDPGTVSIKVNGADTSCTFGAVTATGRGAKTLAIYPGALGLGGDRESVVFKGAISDSSDSSPTSLEVTYNSQTAAPSFVNLSGTNTFTGPITLVKQSVVLTGYLVIGGVRTALINTPGSGTLGNGNYAGTIALDLDTILEYDSSAAQVLSGAITPGANGSGAVTKTGSGLLTLAGKNTYTGNTTVSAGTLVLANTGGLTFVVKDDSNSKITGGGAATLNGSFTIDTTAVSVPLGSWNLVDVATKTFGATFSVTGFTGPDANQVWKLVNGSQIWTFDQTTGKLNLSGPAMIASFNIPGVAGVIDQNALTIALTAPYGTSLATLAPTFTLTSGACNQTSGSPPSPTFAVGNPATYTVTDGGTVNHFTVTVTVTPASTAKDILTFGLAGNAGVINGANIVLTVPYGTDVTALAPTYTVSPLAMEDASFPSGTARDFTTPQTYTITAQDNSTKAYTVTVRAGSSTQALIGHWISGPASLSDTSGFTSAGTHDGVAVGANAAALAWSSDVPAGFTGQSLNLSANNVGVLITNTATTDANYQNTFDEGIATRFTAAFWFKGPLAGTWVGKSGNTPQGWKTRPLSPKADFTMRSNSGETVASAMQSTNSVDDGNWHHIAAVFEGGASYRKLYVDGVLQAQATGTNYAVTFNNLSHLVVGANQGNQANDPIGSFFPGLLYDVRMYNYPLTAAAVANLHSPGLIGHWFSGAADLSDKSGFTSPGTHDGVAVGTDAAALAWSSDVPAGFTGQSLDLSANVSDKIVAVMITNTATTDANYKTTFDEGISNKFTAAFWFKGAEAGTWVSKSGNTPWGWKTRMLSPKADFTMRSNTGETVASAMQSANDVNDGNWHHMAAVFDGRASFREVYVDGVLQARTTGTPYRVNYNNLSHLMVGATQDNGANAPFTTWPFFSGLMYDVRMYGYPLSAAEVDSVYSRRPILTGITGPGPAGFTLQGSTAYAGNLVTWKATNLSPPDWTPVQTNAVPIGTFSITIPLGTDPKAFYQLMVP